MKTLHIIWGKDAIQRYLAGKIDNMVRVSHATYNFLTEEESRAFLYGVSEDRRQDEWLLVTDRAGIMRLGMSVRSRLIEAAKNGDVEAINEILQTGISLELKDEYGMTALHWSAKNGHPQATAILIDAGAPKDAKAEGVYNQTPLHMACHSDAPGAADAVSVLVEKGANVEAQDMLGNRPIHATVSGSDLNENNVFNKLDALVKVGKVDARTENGKQRKACDVAVVFMETNVGFFRRLMGYLSEAEVLSTKAEISRKAKIRSSIPRHIPIVKTQN